MYILFLSVFLLSALSAADETGNEDMRSKEKIKKVAGQQVQRLELKNGMTVLVDEVHTIPKVSVQIWYDVGSKDELIREKGLAHLIEHMLFKGTEDLLSESDINALMQKLSGNTNAFTSYDFTGYYFTLPSSQWQQILPVIRDCMTCALFDDEMLSSEMKAVVQEMKLGRDSFHRTLLLELLSALFPDHPYHYPVIGFKHDLWTARGPDLKEFYQRHYAPNNATLLIVGDVSAAEVFACAKQYFEDVPPVEIAPRCIPCSQEDIIAKTVTLYRDIQQPWIGYAFSIPGLSQGYIAERKLISWILGEKRDCRLYKQLVQTGLAAEVNTFSWDMFDHSIFVIGCQPISQETIPQIEEVIRSVLEDIRKNGVSSAEIQRAVKNCLMELYRQMEDIESRADLIGEGFLATGDPEVLINVFSEPIELLKKRTEEFCRRFFRDAVMHKAMLMPLSDAEKVEYLRLQEESDKQDQDILNARIRTSEVEDPHYALEIVPKDPTVFPFPKPTEKMLDNGLKLLCYSNADLPQVALVLEFKAHASYYDPEDKQGLYMFLMEMLFEGTKNYTAEQLASVIEQRGITFETRPGRVIIECLGEDVEFVLSLLNEVLTNATFAPSAIEQVRTRLLTDLKAFWDTPKTFSSQLFRELIYKGHPWSKNYFGTEESLKSITRDDLIAFYKKMITPAHARLAVVGNISCTKMAEVVTEKLKQWSGKEVEELEYPVISPITPRQVNYPINRDQVVLILGNLSIDRLDPDFDACLLFDQIFGGGVLGSMMSRLFALRESSGLFYGIFGSLVSGADEQPGMFLIKTVVSLDRLTEAIEAIKATIDEVAETITEEELAEARRALVYSQVNYFVTSSQIAETFLYLDRLGIPFDYFDKRYEHLSKITVEDVQKAVARFLKSDSLVQLCVGRV